MWSDPPHPWILIFISAGHNFLLPQVLPFAWP